MKNISKLMIAVFAFLGVFSACNKLDNLKKEEALPVYQLGMSPVLTSSVTTITPTLADSNNTVITFSWTNPKYATDSANTKYVLQIDSSGGSFANPATKTVNGTLNTTLTGRELNSILIGLGFTLNTAKGIDVRLLSSYANNNERYMSNTVKITATAFADGSVLTGNPAAVTLSLLNATSNAIDFSWTRPFSGFTGAVSYTLEYDSATKGFAAPLEITLASATAMSQSLIQSALNQTALNSGIVGGTSGVVEYRIKAVTASGATAYSNVFPVTIQSYFPIRRFYLPGGYQPLTGNGDPWDPPTAPEFIRDQRPGLLNDMYYIYIYLPAGEEFKITQGRSWDINFGGSGTQNGDLVPNGPNNFSVPTSGFYRISINATTLKYDIREGRMGFVGGATGAGWNPPNVFPTYALGNAGTNLFVGLTDLGVDGWKLIDNDQWNNGSNAVDETRSYGSAGGSGTTLETNGANFANPAAAGRYRVIWDGRDRDNVKYEMSPATEMRVVGDGINQAGVNDWDPGSSPQMTYTGNGIWTITISLRAGKDIKFLAGNAWGAFDYEDNSGGSTAVGTERKIKWEGGDNFKTPTTAGTYTIVLNENLQTVTIN